MNANKSFKIVSVENVTLPASAQDVGQVHELCLQHAQRILKAADMEGQEDMASFMVS